MRFRLSIVLSMLVLLAGSGGLASTAEGFEVDGVGNAALDQPQIYAAITLPGQDDPQSTTIDDILGTRETFTVQAFYDTGASGVLLSEQTADALNIPRARFNSTTVTYEDVGVGGSDQFNVSSPVNIRLAPFTETTDVDNPATFEQVYNQRFTNIRTQIGPLGAGNDPLLSGLDVFGVPVFQGKTVVMDNRPVNAVSGSMRTTVYDQGRVPADVPTPDFTLHLSYGDFSGFTRVSPDGAPGPSLNQNPFVGPAPITPGTAPSPGSGPGVIASLGGKQTEGSWLFDTGAAASIISAGRAGELGVTYNGTRDTDNPTLYRRDGEGRLTEIDDQFNIPIGGIGGTVNAVGFFLDSLSLPTDQGEDIVYNRAPVLVADITLADPDTGDLFTLDGVLGMNFLTASAEISGTGGVIPDLGDLRSSAYQYVIYDQSDNTLGLVLIPEPTSLGLLLVGGVWILARRRNCP